jgi:hypothetical protein
MNTYSPNLDQTQVEELLLIESLLDQAQVNHDLSDLGLDESEVSKYRDSRYFGSPVMGIDLYDSIEPEVAAAALLRQLMD